MAKVLMKGNEAMALAAIKGGCDAFFGYPITPQNELPEYLSKHMAANGRVFVQAESEVAAINMVYGAGGSGARVLTSSSSPGIALKQEGISYLAGSEVPAVIINVMRGGPGLGGIQPAQSDYNQITRGGGNGDYRVLSFGPENLQETVDIIKESFTLADKYRNPVMIAADGLLGQMMEPVDLDASGAVEPAGKKAWAATGESGARGRRNTIVSLFLD
ncbi:MAG: 3-methyl-2-oxobutanoate dehydrogenase subunit beta, partial [Bacillota bacterium]